MGLQLAQQINLFQSEFQTRAELVCAKNIQNLFLIILVLLVSLSSYDYFMAQQQQGYLANLKIQQKKLELSLAKVQQSAPSMVVDNKLQQQVVSFKKDIAIKQQVLDALSGQSFGNSNGFSSFFRGLSEQNVPGLWLRNLNISSGGKNIGLTGSAFQPELIPDFLKKLSDEKVFQGTNFQTFQLKREKNPLRVDFYVDTQFKATNHE